MCCMLSKEALLLTTLLLSFRSTRGQLVDVSGCGATKGCLLSPTNCKGSRCRFIATWAAAGGDKVKIELQGRERWVAIGFSNDKSMGDDSVVECVQLASGSVLVQSSYNKPDKGTFDILNKESLSDTSGSFENGYVTCSFTRTIASDNEQIFPLNKEYYVLVGGGPVESDEKGFHSNYPKISSEKIDITTDVAGASGEDVKSTLVRAHGVLMMTAWTIFVCTAIMLARYYKTAWPEKKLCDKMPVWFSIHRVFNTTVSVLTVIAFVLIFVEVKGYSQNTSSWRALSHPVIGIIVTLLAVTNPVMALARCHPGTDNRYIFDFAHWTVGTLANILAVVNTYLGMSLPKSQLFVQGWVKFVLIAFAALYAVTILILERNKCRTASEKDSPKHSATGVKDLKFRYLIFGMYMVCAVTLWAVMLVAMLIG